MSFSPRSILFKNGFVHSQSDPFATAVYVEDGVIAWIGEDDTSASFATRADRVVDLQGALITPAFVDAHVHLLETAIAHRAVDVSPMAGGTSKHAVLALIKAHVDAYARENRLAEPIIASGYNDTHWSDEPLTYQDLDVEFPHALLYVPRADLHSGIATAGLLTAAGVSTDQLIDGRLVDQPHTAVRDFITESMADLRTDLYRSILEYVASQGVVAVHENSAPGIDTRAGLAELLALTSDASSRLPLVIGYRGELVSDVDQVAAIQAEIPGLRGMAGDLSIDGSIGSRSAALREEYADDPGNMGTLHLSQEQVRQHLAACSLAGVSAGFHAIGDRALDVVLAAAREVCEEPALRSAMRRAGHRLEHVELVDEDAIAALVEFGFMVSVQPAFDAHWGGADNLYQARLGTERRIRTTPIREFTRAGVPMAFGSDAPVTAIDPWGGVAAAVFHNNRDFRISARAAFKAHTRGGWRVSGEQNPLVGEIRVGAPAHLAVWQAAELGVQADNDGRSSWSTDARSGSPLLPVLEEEQIHAGERPLCLATLRDGIFIFDQL